MYGVLKTSLLLQIVVEGINIVDDLEMKEVDHTLFVMALHYARNDVN